MNYLKPNGKSISFQIILTKPVFTSSYCLPLLLLQSFKIPGIFDQLQQKEPNKAMEWQPFF